MKFGSLEVYSLVWHLQWVAFLQDGIIVCAIRRYDTIACNKHDGRVYQFVTLLAPYIDRTTEHENLLQAN